MISIEAVSIISNTILTVMIIIFACLQWNAIERQNKQSLFVLRINLYNELNKIMWDILFSFMHIKENIDNRKNASNITLKSLEISHNLLKIKQLFNSFISDTVEDFLKECTTNASNITDNINGENLDFVSVFEKSDSVKGAFENFFNSNKV